MKINKLFNVIIAGSLTVMAIACGGVKESMLTMPKYSIPGKGGVLETTNMKIFLQSGENRNISKSLQANFRSSVEDVVTASGSEVVDRARAGKLIAELNLSSLDDDSGFGSYNGPDIADYVIISTLKKSTVASSFHKSTSWTDKKGKTHTNPAYCSYSAKVGGTIDIRELPSLKRVNIINVDGSGSSQDHSYINRRCNRQGMMLGVTEEALQKTFVKGSSDFQLLTKYVAAKAHIVGARKFDGKVYLETNLGRTLGAEKGAQVNIYQTIEGELVKVTDAVFLGDNNIFSKRGFLKVDQDKLSRIRKGMVVQLSGDCSGIFCGVNVGLDSIGL